MMRRVGRSLAFAALLGGALLVLLAGPLTACPAAHRDSGLVPDVPAILLTAH